MNSRKKGNLLVFFIIAIIALIFSSALATVTAGLFPNLVINEEVDLLYAIDDGDFDANTINLVEIIKNTTNTVNHTNHTNTTNHTNNTDIVEVHLFNSTIKNRG